MSALAPSLTAADEVRQSNRLFLGFLRARPVLASQRLGLSQRASEMLRHVSEAQLDLVAGFPRALFRLSLGPGFPAGVNDPIGQSLEPDLRVLLLTLLSTARSLSRSSGYAARLFLRLDDTEVQWLRHSELGDLVRLSANSNVLVSVLDDLDTVFGRMVSETTPECWRYLKLLGLQPELGANPLQPAG